MALGRQLASGLEATRRAHRRRKLAAFHSPSDRLRLPDVTSKGGKLSPAPLLGRTSSPRLCFSLDAEARSRGSRGIAEPPIATAEDTTRILNVGRVEGCLWSRIAPTEPRCMLFFSVRSKGRMQMWPPGGSKTQVAPTTRCSRAACAIIGSCLRLTTFFTKYRRQRLTLGFSYLVPFACSKDYLRESRFIPRPDGVYSSADSLTSSRS